MAFNERSQQILKSLVEVYIREGQPVGSRKLAHESGLKLSPSTVRNVMAELEERGLIVSPYTSAGRIPTDQGYRFFVDTLLTVQPLDNAAVKKMTKGLDGETSLAHTAETASTLLSEITQMAGVVMLPNRTTKTLRHIEFIRLTEKRVLAILVIDNQDVQNTIIQTERSFTESELHQAANYLNTSLVGRNLSDVRALLVKSLQETREVLDGAMKAAIEMAEQAVENAADNDGDVVIAGQTNLMGQEGLTDVFKLRDLFEAFSEKQRMFTLLDQSLSMPGIQIFIGDESGYSELNKCSLVTSQYQVDGQVLGVLGVIGPTRMAYDRVIPLVDVTAKLLGSPLNQSNEPL